MNKHTNNLLSVITVMILFSGNVYSQILMTGTSIGLSGSATGKMSGAQAVGWNPANLGLKANPSFSVTFLSFGTTLGNNAFSPRYIGDTFIEGDTLAPSQIDEILSKVESDDLQLYSFSTVPLFGLSINSFSLNIDAHGLVKGTIADDLLELALRGPVVDHTYYIDDINETGIAYWTASFSAAKSLTPPDFLDELSLGATFKYLGGLAYSDLVEKNGYVLITHDVINADGHIELIHATRGDGIGLDLGVAAWLKPLDMYCGLTLGNLIGSIIWTDVEANEIRFYRDDGLDIDSLTNEDYLKHLFNETDTTYSTGSVTSPLPRYIILSGAKTIHGNKIDLLCSYYQGLNDAPGHSKTPRIAFGSELRYIPILPLRIGLALGGEEKTQYSFGFGLNLGSYKMNIGMSWQGGLFEGAEGFSFGFTNLVSIQ